MSTLSRQKSAKRKLYEETRAIGKQLETNRLRAEQTQQISWARERQVEDELRRLNEEPAWWSLL